MSGSSVGQRREDENEREEDEKKWKRQRERDKNSNPDSGKEQQSRELGEPEAQVPLAVGEAGVPHVGDARPEEPQVS